MASVVKKLPSKENQVHYIYAERTPQNIFRYGNVDSDKVGKWMLFLDRMEEDEEGLTELDRGWFPIARLVERGHLYNAKCSTALASDDFYAEQAQGVICCYTPNYTHKEGVKRAADSIRGVVNYPPNMWYKTNEATLKGIYRRYGCSAVSLYSQTPDGKFFERDEEDKWKLVRL